MTYERDAYMRRQEEDHDLLRMRQPRRVYSSEGCADAMCADAERDAEACAPLYAEIDRLRLIEALVRELLTTGMRTTDAGLMVVEHSDKSDPHYRLCTELGL